MDNISTKRPSGYAKRIWYFYRDGFREMTVGKTLWELILIKLFILFFILKLFFFPDFLSTKGNTDDESRARYVGTELVERGVQ